MKRTAINSNIAIVYNTYIIYTVLLRRWEDVFDNHPLTRVDKGKVVFPLPTEGGPPFLPLYTSPIASKPR